MNNLTFTETRIIHCHDHFTNTAVTYNIGQLTLIQLITPSYILCVTVH